MFTGIKKIIAVAIASIALVLAGVPAAQAAPGGGVSITPYGGGHCC